MILVLALTPWNAFHNHRKVFSAPQEKNCHHISHVESHAEECLICSTGFEKNYVNTHKLYKVYLSTTIFGYFAPEIKSSFVNIKQTCLRGPPTA